MTKCKVIITEAAEDSEQSQSLATSVKKQKTTENFKDKLMMK